MAFWLMRMDIQIRIDDGKASCKTCQLFFQTLTEEIKFCAIKLDYPKFRAGDLIKTLAENQLLVQMRC